METQFKFGDLIAVRSNSFLSRAIRWFMSKYKPGSPSFSHIATVIDLWGELWIAEALTWGVRIWSLEQSGYSLNKNAIILRFKRGFTDVEIKAMSQKMTSLGGVRYQYENFPQWVAKILLKINLFNKKNERAIYCSELGAIFINTAFPGTFTNPNIISPADHFVSGLYDVIDINNLL
jgi:hypothetical protein